MTVSVRRDKYHGWRLYVDGCPDPARRLRMVYRGKRKQQHNRRVSAAVAWAVVCGGRRSFAYASNRGYPLLANQDRSMPIAEQLEP